MSSGFIPLNKPVGLSSQQAVTRVKSIVGGKKAGHTGTLDPMATGLLLVAVGTATRLSQYFLESDKGYLAELKFGVATDTGDGEGQVIATAEKFCYPPATIAETLQQFLGWISQRPPEASAIKVKGQRAYALFRQGKALALPPRPVLIKSLRHLNPSTINEANPFLELEVQCGKGTYIRSLARDLGTALSCPIHLSGLTRTSIGKITLEAAASFADLESNYRPWLLPPALAVENLPQVQVETQEGVLFIQGRALPAPGLTGEVAVFQGDKLLGLALAGDNRLKPTKVLVQEQEL